MEKETKYTKYGIFNAHNHKRLEDLKKLRDFYIKKGNIGLYISSLVFWYYAYLLLVSWGNVAYADKEAYLFLCGTGYENAYKTYKEREFMRIQSAYSGRHPYLLTNEKFKEYFPAAKALGLKTGKSVSEAERSRLRRRSERIRKELAGETKHAQVEKRRTDVSSRMNAGETIREIAIALRVSLSTIEKDLRALYDEGRLLPRRIRRGIQRVSEFVKRKMVYNPFFGWEPPESAKGLDAPDGEYQPFDFEEFIKT